MNIGVDRQQDLANGFRISQGGIVLVTRDMLAKLERKSNKPINKEPTHIEIALGIDLKDRRSA
jgi:glucose-1-phosphate adenylyltransferase